MGTNSKLAIIGAGSVGTSMAYAALIRSSAREIALFDVQTARVEAQVLDLAHGTPYPVLCPPKDRQTWTSLRW